MGYRLFPYERELGVRELKQLGLQILREGEDDVQAVGDAGRAIARATYFESIGPSVDELVRTAQAVAEIGYTHLHEGNGTRQATRYALHGVHEYKGKFNPQVVRALCNVVDPDANVLIEPFCGCGTALIEGLRLNMDVLGLDTSPIALFLATAKSEATAHSSKGQLAEDVRGLAKRTEAALDRGQSQGVAANLEKYLSDASVAYLRKWFTEPAFAALSQALTVLNAERPSAATRLSFVALSSVLREVSLQLPEDLRIRRRPEPYTAPSLSVLFNRAATSIRQGLAEMESWPKPATRWHVEPRSAESVEAYEFARGKGRRLIVTSPPYATALPYIDTDRLSVVALGLADARTLMTLERELIGSREWTRSEQDEWDERRRLNVEALPDTITKLLARIDRANSNGKAGFRRRAVPSLLYRYFSRMGNALTTWSKVLAKGESAVLIVGHNRTTAGGEPFDIATPELLGDVAESRGFAVSEIIRLQTWPRYGLHSANGVAGEDALVLRRV